MEPDADRAAIKSTRDIFPDLVPNRYPVDVKRRLARRLGDVFASVMQTTPDNVTVAIRELGEGGVWRCADGEVEPAALLMCDIRRGRPPEQRAEAARALVDACVENVGFAERPAGRRIHSTHR